MKKVKIICLVFIISIFIYGFYLGIELVRFNTKIGCKPLINIGNIDVDVTENDKFSEKYKGLGFTIEYKLKTTKNTGDLIINDVLSGEFKLFDKILLLAYAV